MAVIKRKDTKTNPWQARWSDRDGKNHTKHFKTKSEAVLFEARMKAEVSQGFFADPQNGKIRLSRVYEDWKIVAKNLKPKTRASYESLWKCLVEPQWGNRQLQSINRADINSWILARKSLTGNLVSTSRMKQSYVLLKVLLDHAVDMNLISRSPVSKGTSVKIKYLLPKEEIKTKKRVLEMSELFALGDLTGDYQSMILLAGLVGLRWAEIIALTPEDFDFKNKTISVNKSLTEVNGHFEVVTTKNGQGRILPMNTILVKDLKEMVLKTEPKNPVFRSKQGGYLRHSNFSRRIFKPALDKLQIADFTFHSLRHTAISQAISLGVDIVTLSKIAGHSNPSITLNVYGHELNNSLDDFRTVTDKKILSLLF